MKPLLLDTGYLIALEVSDDQNHKVASQHWRGLLKSLPPLVTTTYVFDEVVTFFNSRDLHAKAVEVGNNLIRSAEPVAQSITRSAVCLYVVSFKY